MALFCVHLIIIAAVRSDALKLFQVRPTTQASTETFEAPLTLSLLPACRTTEWSDDESEVRCLGNETETYIEQTALQVSRRCCPRNLGKEEAEVEKQVAENCKVLPCQNIGANPRGHDLCTGLPKRYVPSETYFGPPEILRYKEAIRESCVVARAKDSSEMGAEAVCCPESSGSGTRISVYAAEPFEFPYIANIYNSETGRRCGGAIYNEFYIITAAHCVVNGTKPTSPHFISIIVGTNIALLENRHLHPGFREIVENRIHLGYSGLQPRVKGVQKCVVNDIALLRVNKPLKFGDHVKAIKLAPPDFEPLKFGSHALSGGWGITSNLFYLPYLAKTNLKLRSDATCFHGDGASYPWNATCPNFNGSRENQFLCLGGLARGEAMTDLSNPTNPAILGEGNSGSPVVCRDENGDSLLCGIVSSGGSYPKCLFSRTEETCRFTRASELPHFRPFVESIAGTQESNDVQLFKLKSFGMVVKDPSLFRHQVYIISAKKRCGGTLVGKDAIVTAANCVIEQNPNLRILLTHHRPEEFNVFVRSKIGSWSSEPYSVKSIHIAPGFRPLVFLHLILESAWKDVSKIRDFQLPLEHEAAVNNLAVLRLTREVDIESEELAILPRVSELGVHFPSGVSAISLSIARKMRPDADQLLQYDVRILSFAECSERYRRSYLEFIPDSILCGVEKHSGGSICDQHLGGGVVRRLNVGGRLRDILVGTTNLHVCQLSQPLVYTNMRLFTSWVERVVLKEDIRSSNGSLNTSSFHHPKILG